MIYNIFGSCVTRDAFEFSEKHNVGVYISRCCIGSLVSQKVPNDILDRINIDNKLSNYVRTQIINDIEKNNIQNIQSEGRWIIDLIDERNPYGIICDNVYITLSVNTQNKTNIKDVISKVVQPFSCEHVELFKKSVVALLNKIKFDDAILHKAYYIENEYQRINSVLKEMYDFLSNSLNIYKIIQIETPFCQVNPEHKWGLAPYHYIDGYYKRFLEKIDELQNY